MKREPRSIAEQIDCLARLTGASESFVGEVRELFETKGIPLDSDAWPYLMALEEAFLREERIRGQRRRFDAPLPPHGAEQSVVVRRESDAPPLVPGPYDVQ